MNFQSSPYGAMGSGMGASAFGGPMTRGDGFMFNQPQQPAGGGNTIQYIFDIF